MVASEFQFQHRRQSSYRSTPAARALAGPLLLGFGLCLACDDGARDDEAGPDGEGELIDATGSGTGGTTTGTGGGITGIDDLDVDGSDVQGSEISGGAQESETEGECGEQTLVGVAPTSYVSLALDKSGSMMTTWIDGPATRTRWASLYTTVESMLTEYGHRVDFAIKLFPSEDARKTGPDRCHLKEGMEVPFGHGDVEAMLAEIPEPDDFIVGDTPADAAMDTVNMYMQTQLDPTDRRFSILVMDGRLASCGADMTTLEMSLANALAAGAPTYVIGIDIENDDEDPDLPAAMDRLAMAGGTEAYFRSRDAKQLMEAMKSILDNKIKSCDFPLDPPPSFPTYVSMKVLGERIPRIDGVYSCAEAEAQGHGLGWVYTSPIHDGVDICGASCESFKGVGIADVHYGCEPPM